MPGWDKGMKALSFSAYVAPPASVIGIWSQGYFTHNKNMMRNGFKSAISVGAALSLAAGLKYIVNRKRPYVTYPNDFIQKDKVGPFSFPSGHTTMAFASATGLSLTYKKWYVTTPSFLYAGFVAYSRLRLSVHYPSDVLAGMVLGIGCGLLTWKLDRAINNK